MTPDKKRLDVAVTDSLGNISRATAAKLIEDGFVRVNGKQVIKASFKVAGEAKLGISYDFDKALPAIDIPVIYEDKDVVVIDKPIGLLTHSKGNFNTEATVASWLESRYQKPSGNRSGIAHRLDRATSGVMICAKNDTASKWLSQQFAKRKVLKTYVAVVGGEPSLKEAIIDLPIERNPKSPQSFRVGAGGKSANTSYRVLKTNNQYSLLELRPTTGRTHQLRVHLAYLKHPIVGDTIYKGEPANRLYLHAQSLSIALPSKERLTFDSKLPESFNDYTP